MEDIDNRQHIRAMKVSSVKSHQVPRQLALRVTKFAEHAYSQQREASNAEWWIGNGGWFLEDTSHLPSD